MLKSGIKMFLFNLLGSLTLRLLSIVFQVFILVCLLGYSFDYVSGYSVTEAVAEFRDGPHSAYDYTYSNAGLLVTDIYESGIVQEQIYHIKDVLRDELDKYSFRRPAAAVSLDLASHSNSMPDVLPPRTIEERQALEYFGVGVHSNEYDLQSF